MRVPAIRRGVQKRNNNFGKYNLHLTELTQENDTRTHTVDGTTIQINFSFLRHHHHTGLSKKNEKNNWGMLSDLFRIVSLSCEFTVHGIAKKNENSLESL